MPHLLLPEGLLPRVLNRRAQTPPPRSREPASHRSLRALFSSSHQRLPTNGCRVTVSVCRATAPNIVQLLSPAARPPPAAAQPISAAIHLPPDTFWLISPVLHHGWLKSAVLQPLLACICGFASPDAFRPMQSRVFQPFFQQRSPPAASSHANPRFSAINQQQTDYRSQSRPEPEATVQANSSQAGVPGPARSSQATPPSGCPPSPDTGRDGSGDPRPPAPTACRGGRSSRKGRWRCPRAA